MDPRVGPQDFELCRTLARNFPGGSLAVVDRDMRFVTIDGQLLKHSGTDAQSLQGKRIQDMFRRELCDIFIPYYEAAFRGEEITCEIPIGDRMYRHLVRPVRDHTGVITLAVAMTQDITEQTHTSVALRLSEQRFRTLMGRGSQVMLLTDAQGLIIDQGPSSERIWGWPRALVIARSAFDFIHDDDHQVLREQFHRLLSEVGASSQSTMRIKHRDGPWQWAEATISNLLHDPAVQSMVINFHDITQWRRAMEALRVVSESTAATLGADYIRSLVHGLAEVLGVRWVGVGTVEQGGRIRTMALNADGAAMEGMIFDLEGSAAQAVIAGSDGSYPSGARTRFPTDQLLSRLGTESFYGVPLPSPSGQIIGLLMVMDDKPMPHAGEWASILHVFASRASMELGRLASEEALRRSEELNRRLLEALPGGLIQVDRAGTITAANQPAERFLGLTWNASVQRFTGDFVERTIREDGTRCDPAHHPITQCLATGMPDGPRTIGIQGADDSVYWGVFSSVPLRDPVSAAVDGSVVCFLDITERKRLEDQLRHSQKMDAIGKLAGGVAHDFNNLLTVILGRSELLLDRLPAGDRTRDDIKLFHSTATRAAGLTRQLLAISRQQVSDARLIDLNHAVTHMAELLRGLIGERIEMRTTLEPRLGRILADPTHIEQVILNLCVNARDAMTEGGILTIQTANAEVKQPTAELQPGRYVLLVVKDTGSGIDPRIQSRIFEPFFTTKADNKGTGLGLSTVFGIARQHGGAVSVRSEPGKGSAFFVYLPRSEQRSEPSGPHPTLRESGMGTETILLVEDHDDLRQMLEGLLQARGYRLLTARDGRDALMLAGHATEPIHLLITDMVMPGIGGRELARELANRTPSIKRVLYVSGYAEEPFVPERGALFLQKPFNSDTLGRAVRDLLDE